MDSRKHGSRHPLPLAVSAVLSLLLISGCSSNKALPEKPPAYQPMEVFSQAIHLQAEPGSIVRIGDKVTWLVLWKDPRQQQYLLRFDALCSQDKGWMHYAKRNNMTTFSEGNPDGSLAPEPSRLLRESEPFKAACAQTRPDDWRIVDQRDEQDWLIVDRSNIQNAQPLRHVWIGHDYLRERPAVSGKSLSSQVRSQVAVDCEKQSIRYLIQYDMTASNDVLSGRLYQSADKQELPADQRPALLKAACLSEAELERLPRLQARSKLPALISPPEVAAAAVAAIQALELPAPAEQLQQIDFSYDVQVFHHDIRDEKKTWHVQIDTTTGQTLIRPADRIEQPKLDLTFRGLFTLESSHLLPQDNGRTRLQNLSFDGDWQRLPGGSTVSYTRTLNSHKTPAEKDFARTTQCRIGQTVEASRINTALKGDATALKCDDLKGAVQWSKHYWYLRHYGLFIPAAENGPLGNWQWRVDAVRTVSDK